MHVMTHIPESQPEGVTSDCRGHVEGIAKVPDARFKRLLCFLKATVPYSLSSPGDERGPEMCLQLKASSRLSSSIRSCISASHANSNPRYRGRKEEVSDI
eukprot:1161711-Pelagomonas_calceolata.AAC.4